MENEISSLKKTARLAGILYLIWIITGLYGMVFVSPKIMVKGDAVGTANNLLANEFLFRTSFVTDLIGSTVWVFMALVLYRLFKQVNERHAKLLISLVVVQIPIVFVAIAFNITALMISKGEILKTFELNQRQDLAMLFLKVNDYAVMALEMFWGLWLLPLASLVYKSGFVPRFIGVWLIICGLSYLILSFTVLVLPQYNSTVFYLAIPAFIGELVFMFWLLIKGATSPVGIVAKA